MNNDEKKDVIRGENGVYGSREIRVNLPSNAHNKNQNVKKEPEKLEKVVKGKAVQRKKSLSKKFLETFVGEGESVQSVFGYVIHDVLVPAAKDTLADIVKGSIEMLLFGEKSKGSRTRRDGGRSYVSYDRMSSSSYGNRRTISAQSRTRHNFDEIVFPSRGDAEEVLSNLVDLIIDYGQATVANLYDLSGITENFTDTKYGWTDLSSSSVSRARDGYLLNLPKPILLD